jgi:hypothetical protein
MAADWHGSPPLSWEKRGKLPMKVSASIELLWQMAVQEAILDVMPLSGLRLEESTLLSRDDDVPITVDLSGRHPRLPIYAEAEKGHQDRLLPMTPDFAQFLLQTPRTARTGPVFKLVGHKVTRFVAWIWYDWG